MTFRLHHYGREIQLLFTSFLNSKGSDYALGWFILAFALAFFVVGLFRVVEFNDKGFGSAKRITMIAIHLVGALLAAVAMGLFGLDTAARHTKEIGALLGAAFVMLVPLHTYLALIRRVRMKDAGL